MKKSVLDMSQPELAEYFKQKWIKTLGLSKAVEFLTIKQVAKLGLYSLADFYNMRCEHLHPIKKSALKKSKILVMLDVLAADAAANFIHNKQCPKSREASHV